MGYATIDGLCFSIGIASIILLIAKQKPQWTFLPITWLIIYPIINEVIYNLYAKNCQQYTNYDVQVTSHFVYKQSYNLSFLGLQKLHPFDSHKYGNVWKLLVQRNLVRPDESIKPNKPPRRLLLEKMTKYFLWKLCYTIPICKCIQLPLIFIPGFLLRFRVLNPMLQMTQGTILAACIAKKRNWAVNIGGGFHHAHCNGGGGFCVYPDITLAVHYIKTRLGVNRVMIIDLDAHQGNGHQMDHIDNNSVYTIDCYNHRIYPNDIIAKQAINKDLEVKASTTDEQYLSKIKTIQEDIENYQPEFIIYNAGTDILVQDPLGGCNLSRQCLIKRDQIIFDLALNRKNPIPIIMVLSGGYQKINAQIIAQSLENIIQRWG